MTVNPNPFLGSSAAMCKLVCGLSPGLFGWFPLCYAFWVLLGLTVPIFLPFWGLLGLPGEIRPKRPQKLSEKNDPKRTISGSKSRFRHKSLVQACPRASPWACSLFFLCSTRWEGFWASTSIFLTFLNLRGPPWRYLSKEGCKEDMPNCPLKIHRICIATASCGPNQSRDREKELPLGTFDLGEGNTHETPTPRHAPFMNPGEDFTGPC